MPKEKTREETNALDFQKIRKRRQRLQTVKRLLVLFGVVVFVGAVLYLNALLVEEGFSTHVSDMVESLGGSGYPVALPGGIIRDVKHVGGNLAILNDTNLHLYNNKGKLVRNLQQMTDNTVISTNANRILCYDIGSRRYSIHSASKELASREMEYAISGAVLGDNGSYAVITAPKQFVAKVTVYDKQFEEIYNWSSPENQMANLALSPKGNLMAVGCINTNQNGVLESSIHFFRLSVDAKLAQTDLPGSLILDLSFLSEERVGVLTDQEYAVYDVTGAKAAGYALESEPVLLEIQGNKALVLTRQREARTGHAVLLDASCTPLAEMSTGNNVKDMALSGRYIYLLTDEGISVYNHEFELQGMLELRGISRIHLVGSRLYYFTPDEICVLESGLPATQEEEAQEALKESRPEEEERQNPEESEAE